MYVAVGDICAIWAAPRGRPNLGIETGRAQGPAPYGVTIAIDGDQIIPLTKSDVSNVIQTSDMHLQNRKGKEDGRAR